MGRIDNAGRFRLKGCAKCGGDLVADDMDWLCLQCGTYFYTNLYRRLTLTEGAARDLERKSVGAARAGRKHRGHRVGLVQSREHGSHGGYWVGYEAGVPVEARLSRLTGELDLLVDRRRPDEVAYSLPSGIHWPAPALDLLRDRMATWSKKHGLPAFVYTAKEVRTGIGGHSRAPQDKLAYEVMTMLGLIGQNRTAREWKALAVGCHHLSLRDSCRDSS